MAISIKDFKVAKFDRKYGVNTHGIIHPHELDIPSRNRIYGKSYEPVGVIDFEEIYGVLKIPYEEFTFIDLGSGKGLPCMLASALPFRKIIGVEYSRELNDVAKSNIAIFPRHRQKCLNHEFLCMDAGEFRFPDTPFVLFLYNPFDPPVMSSVVDNVSAAFNKKRRRIIVTYFIPVYEYLWDRVPFLIKSYMKERYILWDSDPVIT